MKRSWETDLTAGFPKKCVCVTKLNYLLPSVMSMCVFLYQWPCALKSEGALNQIRE